MIRLTLLLLLGIGVTLLVAGRDLSPDEIAELGIAAPGAPPREADPQAGAVDVARAASNPALSDPAVPEPEVLAEPRPAAPVVATAAAPDLLQAPAPETATPEAPVPVAAVPVRAETPVEPADLPSIADEIDAALAESQVWYVSGNVVNVRSGPATSFEVVGQVTLGEAAEILSDPNEDWVKIRIQGDGIEGYIARRFLQDDEPNG